MRILLLTQFFQPEPIFKGLPFAKGLRDLGHQIEVITGFPNYPGGKVYPNYRIRGIARETMDGVPVTRLPLFPSHDRSAPRRMLNYLSFATSAALMGPFVASRPDVIYVYNLITLGLASRIIRQLRGCFVVLDVQDIWPESVLNSGFLANPYIGGFLARWCRHEYRSADRVTVLSPGFKKSMIERGVRSEKIDVIYNWCDEVPVNVSEEVASRRRAEAGFNGRFNILFAGTMGTVQALNTVIEGAKILLSSKPLVQFVFLGGGVDVARLATLAAGLPNVRFLPQCSPEEAMAIISVADALLVHLRDDRLFSITIPSKTQAYLYAGKPILMGVRGDAATMILEAKAGIAFEPENPQSLVESVNLLVGMRPEQRLQMGENGKKYYQENLAFRHGLRRFDKVFHAAANRSDCLVA